MKIFCENKLTIEECKQNLEEEYRKNKEIKFFKEIDWHDAFISLIVSMFLMGVICVFGCLFLKNISFFMIVFSIGVIIFTGFFIYVNTNMTIDDKKEYLLKIKDAYENKNEEEFLDFLASYYYKEYKQIIFTLLEKNEIKILKLQYSQDTDILNFTYDKNGLVNNDRFYVKDYQLRTDIKEDELTLDKDNDLIYKTIYNKEEK